MALPLRFPQRLRKTSSFIKEKNMNRKLVLPVVVLSSMLLCTTAFAEYKPGTYKSVAYGKKDKKHTGKVEVEVTLSADKIEDIKVLEYEQSVGHKKYGPLVNEAREKIPAAMVASQTVQVDGVAKATMASTALQLAVARVLHDNTVAYKPGTYKGTAMGRSDKKHTGTITVEVTVSENKIEDIKVLEYEQSVSHKKYGAPVTEAKEKIPAAIVANQSLDLDAVAKATMASNALELAVGRALEQAR